MYSTKWYKLFLSITLTLAGLVVLFSLNGSATTSAQSESVFVRHIRNFDHYSIESLHPGGLAFSNQSNEFLVLEAVGPGESTPPISDFISITPTEERKGSVPIAASIKNPLNITFDNKFQRLFFFRSAKSNLFEISLGPDGVLDPTTLTPHNARKLGLKDPQGMAVSQASGQLFILDRSGPTLVSIMPDAAGNLDESTVTAVDLGPIGLIDPRGLAFDPTNRHLHILNPGDQKLYELTEDGSLVAIRDLSAFDINNSQGLVLAPSGDLTDDPQELSLYIADSGSGGEASAHPTALTVEQEVGQIIELSFAPAAAAPAATFVASLVQTIDTWKFSPPSSDPAGITYLPSSNTLLFSDSEVNELSIYEGANLFEIAYSGTVLDTGSTLDPVVLNGVLKSSGFSKEPTGVSFNPSNGHLFVTDDDKKDMYEVDPGLDGLIFTSGDNSVTSFETDVYNNSDPEGLTYDIWQGGIFIADGISNEVYHLTVGANGFFDGPPQSGGDDVLSNFDTANFGLEDPEGITFNNDNGNLYIVGKPATLLFEVTTSGALVQTIDISAANADKPAGLAYAPSSNNSGEMNIYIVDRMVDNGKDPNENDGRLYELTLPQNPNVDPVASDDSSITQQDTMVSIDVAANDSDVNGNLDPTTANTACTTCSDPTSGTLINKTNGTFDYTPNLGFTGTDSFVYEICDSEGLCDTATVNITVTPTNDPPLAVDDSASTEEDTAVSINVAANDGDPDGNLDPATANTDCVTCTDPANGTLVNNANGSFNYTPNPNFNGSDGFVYEVCDTLAACDTATVSITVTAVPDKPVANNDSATTQEEILVNVDVAANDTDPENNLVFSTANTSCATCSGPADGTVVNNANGSFDYTPAALFTGTDSFVYEICDSDSLCDTATVTITVYPADPIVFEARVAASSDDAEENSSGRVSLTSSDLELIFDKNEQTVGLRFTSVTIPPGATISNAFIQFQADETNADPTTLTIEGQAIDNAPTFVSSTGNISSRVRTTATVPWAAPAWTTKNEAGPAQQTSDITAIIQEIVGRPTWVSGNAMVVIFTGSSTSKQLVAESYNGVQAAAPLLHVEYFAGEPNDSPLANDDATSTLEEVLVTIDVTANDSDANGNLDPTTANTSCATCAVAANGILVNNADGTFNYTPNLNFNGSDGFEYEVCDTHLDCDTATVTITVTAVPDVPVANNDSATTEKDTLVNIDVAANDTDADADLVPATANTSCTTCPDPTSGTLVNKTNGTFDYTPNLGFTGTDSFVYEICDSEGLCDTATVNITVTPTNDPPLAVDDSASTEEDTAVSINVAANDGDPDGNLDPATANTDCVTCTDPANGTLVNNANGSFNYTPNPNFNGSDGFVYEVCDTLAACDTATVSITVTAVPDKPVANNDSATTQEEILVNVDVAANDTDPENNLVFSTANTSCATCSGPADGTVVNNANGSFDYTPAALFTGTDSFVYEICDSDSLCDTATVTITVYPADPIVFEARVAASSDDAEENSSGRVSLTSSDLELIFDKNEQTVGLRFAGMAIPPGATISNAFIQFQADETNADPTTLTIEGQAIDNAPTFVSSTGNISSRVRTTATVSWAAPAWTTKNEAGPAQQTSDITAIIQEIVGRPTWVSGNAMVVIFTGSGTGRQLVAESYNGVQAAAPLLHIEYFSGS